MGWWPVWLSVGQGLFVRNYCVLISEAVLVNVTFPLHCTFYHLQFVLTAIECLPLDPITNGVITYAIDTTPNYDLGTVATYECDAGFFLDLSLGGSEMRTCVDDLDNDVEGMFSGQAPACIRK